MAEEEEAPAAGAHLCWLSFHVGNQEETHHLPDLGMIFTCFYHPFIMILGQIPNEPRGEAADFGRLARGFECPVNAVANRSMFFVTIFFFCTINVTVMLDSS